MSQFSKFSAQLRPHMHSTHTHTHDLSLDRWPRVTSATYREDFLVRIRVRILCILQIIMKNVSGIRSMCCHRILSFSPWIVGSICNDGNATNNKSDFTTCVRIECAWAYVSRPHTHPVDINRSGDCPAMSGYEQNKYAPRCCYSFARV